MTNLDSDHSHSQSLNQVADKWHEWNSPIVRTCGALIDLLRAQGVNDDIIYAAVDMILATHDKDRS